MSGTDMLVLEMSDRLEAIRQERDAAVARAERAEAALKRALGEAQYWESRCRREADEALTLGAECDSLRLALAAVPVRAIRRIIEMHDAHAWSSVESPPLYAAVRAWLEVQP